MDDWSSLLPALEFAYNSSYNVSIDSTPFELDLGYLPRSPADFFSGPQPLDNPMDAPSFEKKLKYDVAIARDAIKISQAVMKSRHPNNVKEFQVGDKVKVLRSLLEDPLHRQRPKAKWRPTYAGPYTVKKVLSKHVYQLDFPPELRAHKNVNVAHLEEFKISSDSDFPGRILEPPPPVIVNDEEEYTVKEILDHKKRPHRFLTKFAGYPAVPLQWLHENSFIDPDGTVTQALVDYVKFHPDVGSKHLHDLLSSDAAPEMDGFSSLNS
jgi:hypothetical protein